MHPGARELKGCFQIKMDSSSRTLGRQVIKNSFSILLRGGAQIGFVALITPYILHRLGNKDFGVWSLIYIFISYAALFDLGISGSLAKFAGGIDASRSPEKIGALFSSALWT